MSHWTQTISLPMITGASKVFSLIPVFTFPSASLLFFTLMISSGRTVLHFLSSETLLPASPTMKTLRSHFYSPAETTVLRKSRALSTVLCPSRNLQRFLSTLLPSGKLWKWRRPFTLNMYLPRIQKKNFSRLLTEILFLSQRQ